MNLKTIGNIIDSFSKSISCDCIIDERNYFYGILTNYTITEQLDGLTLNYQLRTNFPDDGVGNRFAISLASSSAANFKISYSPSLIKRLVNSSVLKYSDRNIKLKTQNIIVELTELYHSFTIDGDGSIVFKTTDLPKTVEQIEMTKGLMIAMQKACI